jgi:hypothetical protein
VLQGILKSYYETTFSQFHVVAAANPNDKGVYSLALTGGQIDIGVIQEQQNTPSGAAYYWSGSSGWPSDDPHTDMVIQLAGIQISIQDLTHMSVSANLGWNQSWGVSYPVPRTEGYRETSLQSSQTQQFKAENTAGKALTPTWSVVSAANTGSIDANGKYTASCYAYQCPGSGNRRDAARRGYG